MRHFVACTRGVFYTNNTLGMVLYLWAVIAAPGAEHPLSITILFTIPTAAILGGILWFLPNNPPIKTRTTDMNAYNMMRLAMIGGTGAVGGTFASAIYAILAADWTFAILCIPLLLGAVVLFGTATFIKDTFKPVQGVKTTSTVSQKIQKREQSMAEKEKLHDLHMREARLNRRIEREEAASRLEQDQQLEQIEKMTALEPSKILSDAEKREQDRRNRHHRQDFADEY